MRFRAIVRQRCPRCLDGKVFRGLWKMNPCCSRCGLTFEREHGYFTGAMYFAYLIGVVTLIPLTVSMLVFDLTAWWIALAAEIQIVVTAPLLFRYSRVLWLHLDQVLDPR